MCSGSEAGSYLRLIDFVYQSTLGLRVIKRERENEVGRPEQGEGVLLQPKHLGVGFRVQGLGFRV